MHDALVSRMVPRMHETKGLANRATFAHTLDTIGRCHGTDQDGFRNAHSPSHDVQAVMHPVGEVDVSMPRRPVHDLVTRRAPSAGRMTREISRTAIGLHLDDDPRRHRAVGRAIHEQAAEQIAGYAKGGAVVEGSREGFARSLRSRSGDGGCRAYYRSSTAKRMFFFSIPSSTMSRPPLRIIHSRR